MTLVALVRRRGDVEPVKINLITVHTGDHQVRGLLSRAERLSGILMRMINALWTQVAHALLGWKHL